MNPKNEKLEAIFEAALALESDAQRQAYLARACPNAELRREVELLLDAHRNPDSLFAEEPADSQATRRIQPFQEALGTVIGRYKLRERIGEGGCGVVYVAEQEEPVRRRVALKVIKLGMDTKSVVARFQAERQALAMMDHPNIAKVLDAGATETGRPYFVMELVRGIKITDYCDQNNLPTLERLDLFIQVCRAVQHAHQKGIIHRDLKPSNILVTLHDGVPVPKVIDFGIAKATEGRLTDLTVYTELHQFIGTPAYMSPEQAEMSGLDIDTRSDIYSLGVLLYELLTGKTPFDAKELLEAGLDEMRRTIREKEPVRPSTRLSTMLEGELTTTAKHRAAEAPKLIHLLRGDLDWIVMKALEKDRTRRYETANGLAMDIERHLSNEAVVARPPSNLYQFQKLVRRNKLAFGATAAIAAALLIGLGVSSWSFLKERQARHRAVSAEREQSRLREDAVNAQAGEAHLRRQAEAQAYASDINLAQQALATDNLGRAQDLLDRHRPQPGQQDLRGWEWRYLWRQCKSDALYTLCQKSNSIWSLAVSHDGKWLAVGEYEKGLLSLWDLRTRQEVASVQAGELRVIVAFSPKEPLLAFSTMIPNSASKPRFSLRLWNPVTRQTIADLPLASECHGLAFSSDGEKLITYAAEGAMGQIAVWRVADAKNLGEYHASFVWSVGTPFAVTERLDFVAHGMSEGWLRVLDLATGKERCKVKAAEDWITALAFSPDGKTLASAGGYDESSIRLWDVGSGKEIKRLDGHRRFVTALIFFPDGKTLASASADQTIRFWDMVNFNTQSVLRGHREEVWRLALISGSKKLVSGSRDGSIYVWETTTTRREGEHVTLPMPVAPWNSWRFAPDSKSVIAVDQQGRVARWQGADFQEMQPLLEMGTNFFGAAISDDGRWVAAGSTSGNIEIWDLEGRAAPHHVNASTQPAYPHRFLAQRNRLGIFNGVDCSFHEWDQTTWQETRSWRGPAGIGSGALSPDGRWCLMFHLGGGSVLRDVATGREKDLEMRQASDATFSPDGNLCAVSSMNG